MTQHLTRSPVAAPFTRGPTFPDPNSSPVVIRQLWPVEVERLARHYKRLHPEDRWRRFGSSVSDDWLDAHALDALGSTQCIVKGAFVRGSLRGVAEAWFSGHGANMQAETAFSLERGFQKRGIGDRLFKKIIRAARNRGATRLQMVCMRDNPRMIALARANEAELSVSPDGITGEIRSARRPLFAFGADFMDESLGYWLTLPRWRTKEG